MKKVLASLLLSLAVSTAFMYPAIASLRQMNFFKAPVVSSWTFADAKSTNFTATNQVVTLTDPANLRFTYNAPFSVSFWVKVANTTNSYGNIIGRCLPSGNFTGWEVAVLAQTPILWFAVDVTHYIQVNVTTAIYTTGAFFHTVMTYSGSGTAAGVKFYINNVAKGTTTILDNLGTGNTVASSINAYVGGTIFGTGILAKIDDIAVFNSELTSGNVTTLYNSGHNGDVRGYSFAGNLIYYSPMGDSDDATTSGGYVDRSTSGYNGTGSNMTNATNIVADVP